MNITAVTYKKESNIAVRFFTALVRYKWLYILLIPAAVSTVIFAFIPLGGLIVAFKDYDIWLGFLKSPWTDNYGFKHFINLVKFKPMLFSIINTVYLSLLNLGIGFPAPIIFALLVNELTNRIFKKSVQTISYMPHFLSWISVIGLCQVFFGDYGPFNELLSFFNPERSRQLYLSRQVLFVPMLIILNLWKSIGFNAIIYLAAITGVDPQLYDAASVDGAGRFNQLLHITLPGITATIAVMFILSIGGILQSNFELVFGLQNSFIDFETIDTVIYKYGLLQKGYSLSTAIGLVRGLITLGLIVLTNAITKKLNDVSVF